MIQSSHLSRAAPIDITTQWEEDWLLASVVNQHLVCDPSIKNLAFFDLPCQSWTLLNRFQTDQGPCRANLHKSRGLAASELCDCSQRQTMGSFMSTNTTRWWPELDSTRLIETD